MVKRKFKLVFVGGGINSAIGKTHEIAIKMDNLFELVGGYFSRNQNINKKTAKLWNVKYLYENYQELLNDKKNFDALVVLTPTDTHYDMIKKALNENIPVISEKTLVSSYEEALDLKRIVEKNKSFLLTTYNYTGYPMIRELEYMIKNGYLGKIIYINIQMPQESFIRLDKFGNVPKPQEWRLKDSKIPTISLDLGTHLSNMIDFLVKKKPVEVIAMESCYGHYDVIDNITCMVLYEDNINCNMWYSKAALGHKNGLKVEIYGTKGSAIWYQMNPEFLESNDNQGRNILLDRSSKDVNIANLNRYNRFKSGHPAGFIEAFANHYQDIYQSLTNYFNEKKYKNDYVFDIYDSVRGLMLMEGIESSIKSKKWEKMYVED